MSDTLMDYDEAVRRYDPVLGLEVHVELGTATKMFDAAPNVFGAQPNTMVTPTSVGLPGALPVVNARGVEYAIRIGLALGCEIAESCRFARKNYFYPDLAKDFQTSQPMSPSPTTELWRSSWRTVPSSPSRSSGPIWRRTPARTPTSVVPTAVSRAPATLWWTTTALVCRWWRSSPAPSRAPVPRPSGRRHLRAHPARHLPCPGRLRGTHGAR